VSPARAPRGEDTLAAFAVECSHDRTTRRSFSGIAAPACSFARLWTEAKQRGAPAGSVAVITYDASGYEFRIDGTEVRLRFDMAFHAQGAARR